VHKSNIKKCARFQDLFYILTFLLAFTPCIKKCNYFNCESLLQTWTNFNKFWHTMLKLLASKRM